MKTVVIKRQDRIDYVINGVCDYYNIAKDDLMTISSTQFNRRRMTIKILRDIADVPFKDICASFARNSIPATSRIYAEVSDDLNPYCYGNKELKAEYKDILKHLGL